MMQTHPLLLKSKLNKNQRSLRRQQKHKNNEKKFKCKKMKTIGSIDELGVFLE